MAIFVLVHGAWHGGWCWAELQRELRHLGHEAHAPTLTGLGERSHLLTPDIDPNLHVTDVVNTIRWRELEEVFLVGHSYGGMVITGVAGQVPEKLSALVYLDAFVPEESDVSSFAKANPERMARFEAQIADGRMAVDPDRFDTWTDDPDIEAWLRRMCTPHPNGCLRNGVTLTGREQEVKRRYYILAERNSPSPFWGEYEKASGRPGWQADRMDAKHDVMVEQPQALAHLLHTYCS